jgi:hypothetical protein
MLTLEGKNEGKTINTMGFIQDCLKASKGLPPHLLLNRGSRLLVRRGRELAQKAMDRRFSTDLSDHRFQKILSRIITEPTNFFQSHISFPGYCPDLGLLSEGQKAAMDCLAEQTYLHRFDLLGSGRTEVSYTARASGLNDVVYRMNSPDQRETIAEKMREAADKASCFVKDTVSPEFMDALRSYEPIDWHLDFKSGWRWPEKTWYKDIKYIQTAVDIKISWELSRFQHLLYLAFQSKKYYGEIILQVLDWIVSNPPRTGVNWVTTMDVGIRAANWIAAFAVIQRFLPRWFLWILTKSLYQHAVHISKNLEYSLWRTGNHYLSNIVGLLSISSSFCFPESPVWSSFCVQELVKEMGRTVYADGCDYEASTNYHRLVTELFYHGTGLALQLDRNKLFPGKASMPPPAPRLIPLKQSGILLDSPGLFPEWYFDRLKKMARYVEYLCMPDGNTPSFGDMDNGRFMKLSPVIYRDQKDCVENFRDHRHILGLASGLFPGDFSSGQLYQFDGKFVFGRIKFSCREADVSGPAPAKAVVSPDSLPFTDSGVFVLTAPGLWLALFNSGTGQNGLGGHSHNDNLSFELWSEDLHIFDPGTYLYTPAPESRDSFRSTVSHSTWMIDGEEQLPLDDGLFNLKSPVMFYPEKKNLDLRPFITRAGARSWTGGFFYGSQEVARKTEILKRHQQPDMEGYPVVWAIVTGNYLVLFRDSFECQRRAQLSIFSNAPIKERLQIFIGISSIHEEVSSYSPGYGNLKQCCKTTLVRKK